MNNEPISRPILALRTATDSLRDVLILVLIAFFILLYASVLTGWFKPVSDVGFLNRIEPIIFLIIGYYFGRLPSERNERMLKDEVTRQTRRADASDQQKERLLCEGEIVEERVRNAKAVLTRHASTTIPGCDQNTAEDSGTTDLEASVKTALRILA